MKNKAVLVTGAYGFVGSHLVEELRRHRYRKLILPTRRECDLMNRSQVRALLQKTRPYAVIHCAGRVGGIMANKTRPGDFFYENAVMGCELLEGARLTGVAKTVILGTVCSYPKHTPVPFKESRFWQGYPEETNAPYGLAKKMLWVQCKAYRQQYGFKFAYLLPANMYGPGDNFDPSTSHVIPSMIYKFAQAKRRGQKEITFLGDGSASREFLYVADCARAVRLALERYEGEDPVNIGTGEQITIRALVRLIAGIFRYKGRIHWDTGKPNGQPRRQLDVSRSREAFGFESKVSLKQGLVKTIRWYLNRTQ